MTANPIPALMEMFEDLDTPMSVRFDDHQLPRIRLDLVGGTDSIPGIHDGTLVTVVCFDETIESADTLARQARALLAPGTYGDAVVTRATSTPPRYEDGSEWTPPAGVALFTARVWLHAA